MPTEKIYTEEKYKLCQMIELSADSKHKKVKRTYKKFRKQLMDDYFQERLDHAWNLYLASYQMQDHQTKSVTIDKVFLIKLLIGCILAAAIAYTLFGATQADEWSSYLIVVYAVMSIMSIGFPFAVMFWIRHERVHLCLRIPLVGIYSFVCLVTILSTWTVPYFTIKAAMNICHAFRRRLRQFNSIY